MSGAAGGLDLRYPIGGLFCVLGGILAVYGLITGGDTAMYARSGGLNINLTWGAVMVVFGVIMLALSVRASRRR